MNLSPFPSEFLQAVHTAKVFSDDKEIVDRPLRVPPACFLSHWNAFSQQWDGTPSTLMSFIHETTQEAGSDLRNIIPVDWKEKTEAWLPHLHGFNRTWAVALHTSWRDLCRSTSVLDHDRHTLLPLPFPFFIPGGRFREMYYWDSYWIILGLFVSEMFTSAMNQIESLLSMLPMYGCICNGNRQYYRNRSQPPIMAFILRSLQEAERTNSQVVSYDQNTNQQYMMQQMTDEEKQRARRILKTSLPLLIQEHRFWTHPPHGLMISHNGKSHQLSRYYVSTDAPRLESFGADMRLAKGGQFSQLFRDIAAATESGWDFSSRWCRSTSDLSTLDTTSILPVDLNAFLYMLEITIEEFSESFGDAETMEEYRRRAAERQHSFNTLFWDEMSHQWRDVRLTNDHAFVREGYLSNYVPLACGIHLPEGTDAKLVVRGLASSGLVTTGGCLTSLYDSGQQWDAPNVWPPLQSLIIDGLRQFDVHHLDSGAADLATRIACGFLTSAAEAFKRDGAMYEKYGREGTAGHGGEYVTQIGFGWTNGIVLHLLTLYGEKFNTHWK